jgi:hypothetical protein
MKLYDESYNYSYIALSLGVLSMLAWMIPALGVVTSVVCIYLSAKGFDTKYEGLSKGTLVLGIVGFILAILRGVLLHILI